MKMKSKIAVVVFASASWLTLPLIAQEMSTDPKTGNSGPQNVSMAGSANPQKANKIIGMECFDSQGQKLGRINDMAVDVEGGRIAEVIVGTGNPASSSDKLMGEEKYVAVPPGCFSWDASGNKLRLNASREQLNSAPAFDTWKWKESTVSANLGDVYQRFGGQLQTAAFGNLEKATKIMGMAARDDQHDKLAKVSSLVVDLPAGRIDEVIVASGGFLGIGSELSAMPPQSFHYDSAQDLLILNSTRDALKNAPHFKSSDWRNYMTTAITPATRQSALTSTPMLDNDQVNAPRGGSITVPSKAVDAQRDDDITTQVREKIRSDTALSQTAQNVQVTTKDGRVTLRGTVNTDKEKQRVGEIAAEIVSADYVDNELEVSTASLAGK